MDFNLFTSQTQEEEHKEGQPPPGQDLRHQREGVNNSALTLTHSGRVHTGWRPSNSFLSRYSERLGGNFSV